MNDTQINLAADSWNSGRDTLAIGKLLALPEHVVYSRIFEIRRVAEMRRRGIPYVSVGAKA